MGNNEGRFYRPLDRDRRASIGCRSDERKFCDKAGPSMDVRPVFTRNISAMARMAFLPSGGCVSAIFRMDSRHSSNKLTLIWPVPYALPCRQPEKEVWWLAFVPKISANEEKIRAAQYKPPNDYKLTGACRPSGTEYVCSISEKPCFSISGHGNGNVFRERPIAGSSPRTRLTPASKQSISRWKRAGFGWRTAINSRSGSIGSWPTRGAAKRRVKFYFLLAAPDSRHFRTLRPAGPRTSTPPPAPSIVA